MLKKYAVGIGISLSFLFNCTVMANSMLEKNIVDVIKSNQFTIQYTLVNELTNIKNDTYEATKQYMKDNRQVITVIKNGNENLSIVDHYKKNKLEQSMAMLYKDGVTYSIVAVKKKCYNDSGFIKGVPLVKMTNNTALQMFEGYFSNTFSYHLLPLVPSENKVNDINGNEVTSNICNVFVRDGKEDIGGTIVDFIEYKTPSNMEVESVGRYYLLNGILIKYIRLDKEKDFPIEEEWQKAYGTDKYGYGGYAILDVKQFTKYVNPNLFQIPKSAKIHEVNMPTNFY